MRVISNFAILLVAMSFFGAAGPRAHADATIDSPVVAPGTGVALDAAVEHVHGEGFHGAVLVAKDGEILLMKGYGMADREHAIPWTTSTVFTIGSITKQFTAAAILTLEQTEALHVDDALSTFVPGVPADKRDITLQHLLTHSAGIPADFGGDFDLRSNRPFFLEQALNAELLWTQEDFGVKYEYSNAGYSLLGVVIEETSGKDYERYLHETLFAPLEMNETGYTIPAWDQQRIAHGYRRDRDWGTVRDKRWLDDGPCWNLRCNGGMHSTLGDLYRWHVALQGDAPLSAESKEKYFGRHVRTYYDGEVYYGYGWKVSTTPRGTTLIRHGGGNGIFSADFLRYVDDDVVIILASNIAEHTVTDVLPALEGVLWP